MNSFICFNGTGTDDCNDSYDRANTIFRENDHGTRILPAAVCNAYNLPTTTTQHQQIVQDAHSGYSTDTLGWNILNVGLPNQADPVKMATIAT